MDTQVYSFRVAGVTMDGRQAILRKLRRAIMKRCPDGKAKDAIYRMKLGNVNTRIREEPENEHDKDAVAIDVFSGSRGWLNIGYVPKKTKLGKGDKRVSLNKVVKVLIKHDLIKEVRMTRLEYFKNEEDVAIFFCFITIEYETV